ncbi:MAG: hypothetical protein WAM85_07840 [Terracidiphilus sp.]
MRIQSRNLRRLLGSIAIPVLLVATISAAQTRPAPPARPAAQVQQDNAPIPTDRDVAATQSELIKLLRLSPTLTTVVSHDPSLLSNQDYVAHNNPQLAEFLTTHPEVARNPEFYLFSHLNHEDGSPDEALERAVWPRLYQRNDSWSANDVLGPIAALLAFACFLVALTWLVRVFLENRRWGRIFKLQSEVHGRLIDKFSSNQELASYMETEAGKRFLEASPIPVAFEPSQRVPNVVARVLTPIQIGVVLVLLGIGILLLRHARPELEIPMLVFGTVVLMPGIGFIISAGITWVLAARLGLMPDSPAEPGKFDAPFASSFTPKDRQ